jgi:methylenetetrahydrofolate reductase (NADPH)
MAAGAPQTVFGRDFSLEATRPSPAEIAAVVGSIGTGHALYLSAVPAQSFDEPLAAAVTARRAGLEPVLHLPARRFREIAECRQVLERLAGEAGVRRALLIAGDIDTPGTFPDTLALMRSGVLQRSGIRDVGIAGYPDGHPRIASESLARALTEKLAIAAQEGLRVQIVSQFCFDAAKIVAWLRQLRSSGVTVPVRVGLAGPTSLTALLRFARRCGVSTSVRGMMSGAATGLIGQIAGQVAGPVGPDRIIDALVDAGAEIGEAAPHYFSFGGLAATARYAQAEAARRSAAAHVMTDSN